MSITQTPIGPPPERVAPRSPSTPPATATTELHLTVSDPEVVNELSRHPAGPERERFALAALRVGVLALRTAGGQLDGATIREAGERMLGELRELLAQRAGDLTRQLGETLTRYLDPQSGSLPRRLEDLVRSGGDLERVLRTHLAPDESLLARTLAQHLGESSPVFRLLSPDDAGGLRAQVEQTLARVLAEQREQILRQFSLDDRESALSRLVAELRQQQTQLQTDVRGQVETMSKEFSLDKPDSALARLVARVDAAQKALVEQHQAFHGEVRASLAALQARREEAAQSTRHGATFEEALGAALQAEAQRGGDVHEATGNTTGVIKNCKKGDHVVTLGPDCAAPGARIVWEAKEDRSYDLRTALAEIDEARRNRQAQVGVFVFSRRTAPAGLQALARYGRDLAVVWDAEDPASDLVLHGAASVARALAVRERGAGDQTAGAIQEIELATRTVEKQIGYLEDVRTWSTTIKSNAEKMLDRASRMAADLRKEVDRLDAQLAALKTGD